MSTTLQFNFSGKNVVVTGGARGIGLEITRQFLSAGASVSVWEFSAESIATAREALKAYVSQAGASADSAGISGSARLHFQQVDVSKSEDCDKAARELPFAVDILVNNAGITRDKSFAKMTDEDFDAVIETNLGGVFKVTKSLLPKFNPSNPNKRIISLSSVVALYGNFGQTNYVAAKAGVIGLTKTWSRELARKGFTVNAIAPGFIKTPMVELMPAEALKGMADKVPAARLGEPIDIANTCLFLASNEASYITGTVISVDGGLVT